MRRRWRSGCPRATRSATSSSAINGRMLGPRRTDPGQAGRAGAIPCAERERERDPQPGTARPTSGSSRSTATRCRPGERARAVAGYGGTYLGDRQDEPSRRLGAGRSSDDDRGHGMGIVVEYAGASGQAPVGNAAATPTGTTRASAIQGLARSKAGRDDRHDDRQGERGHARLQSLDDQRRGVLDGDDDADVHGAAGAGATGCRCATPATTSTRCTCTGTASSWRASAASRPPG